MPTAAAPAGVSFLAPEWVARTAELAGEQPRLEGASARVQFVVTGAPGGPKETRYYWTIEDGRLGPCGAGTLDDADVTLTATYRDATGMAKGELDPGAAFMRGTLKVAGDMGRVLTLLSVLATDAYRDLYGRLGAETDFS